MLQPLLEFESSRQRNLSSSSEARVIPVRKKGQGQTTKRKGKVRLRELISFALAKIFLQPFLEKAVSKHSLDA